MADQAEIALEQKYFGEALEFRERRRHQLGQAPDAAANPKAAVAIRRGIEGVLKGFRPPEEAVAFGRIDREDGDTYYIGYQAIWNDDNDALVVPWQAPVAEPFYEATHVDPKGLARKRQYKCERNEILDIEDAVFSEIAARVAALEEPGVEDDLLLASLERHRGGEMEDIVRTIRAAQYRVIRAEADQLLVVQGGPGTGKTAVALHRVSWLLYNHRDELRPSDVLVVGPNRTFVRYIRGVLPSLGDQDVHQLPLERLGPEVQLGLTDPPEVVRLKGEARMARLLDRGFQQRVALPDSELQVRTSTGLVRLDRSRIAAEVDRLRSLPYAVGRQRLREFLRAEARGEGEVAVRADLVDGLLERIWPQLTPPQFLQDLLGSEARLVSAAGDDFTAREVRLLYRRSAGRLSEQRWSLADVPLLDHVHSKITGEPPARYKHIVVDEAQDLSPMQLQSIRRRSLNGSMTVLGDVAQSTGHWARDSWEDVVAELADGQRVAETVLEVGYRVPKEVFEVAEQLLPHIAPTIAPPRVLREVGHAPTFRKVTSSTNRASVTVNEARAYAADGLSVGVVCPSDCWSEVVAALDDAGVRWTDAEQVGLGSGINLIRPESVKGLEFDSVVVVEPNLIVNSRDRGLRLLYVALTRTTHRLSVVHIGAPLPTAASETPRVALDGTDTVGEEVGSGPRDAEPDTPANEVPRTVRLLVASVASEVRNGLRREHWDVFVEELRQILRQEDV